MLYTSNEKQTIYGVEDKMSAKKNLYKMVTLIDNGFMAKVYADATLDVKIGQEYILELEVKWFKGEPKLKIVTAV